MLYNPSVIIISHVYLYTSKYKVKNKADVSLQQAVKGHRFVRRRDSHIFQIIGSQLAVRLSALLAGSPVHPDKIPDTHFY
jgi:hypothetical protein